MGNPLVTNKRDKPSPELLRFLIYAAWPRHGHWRGSCDTVGEGVGEGSWSCLCSDKVARLVRLLFLEDKHLVGFL